VVLFQFPTNFNNDAEGYAIQNVNELQQLMETYRDRLRVR
jgi:hypothetical protein